MLHTSVIPADTERLTPLKKTTSHLPVSSRHTLLKEHVRKYKGKLLGIVLAGLLFSITSFLLTLLIGDYFMLRFDTGSSKARLLHLLGIQLSQPSDFYLLFGFLLLVRFVAGFFEQYGAAMQAETWVRTLREKLFTAQMSSLPEQFAMKNHESYLLRYSNDMKAIQSYLSRGILGGIRYLIFLVAGIVIMAIVHIGLALFMGGCFVVMAFLIGRLAGNQKEFISKSRAQRSSLLAFAARSFRRFNSIRQEKKTEGIIDRFNRRSQFLYEANMLNNEREAWIHSLARFLPFLALGFLLWMMGSGMVSIHPSDGIVIILLVMQLQGALRSLLKVPGILNKGRISIDKVSELITNQPQE